MAMTQGSAARANPPLSASRRRRERERLAMRARLLEAARDIAAEEGWQAVTIRKIADRLEYSSPILYQHFASKEALLLALVAEGFREVTGLLRDAAREAEGSPERLLEGLALAYWDFAFAAPELYQAMNGLDGVPFGTAQAPPEAREGFAVVHSTLRRLAAYRGRVLTNPEGAVDTVWAYLHGFVSLTMAGRIAGGREHGKALMLQSLPALFESMLA
jgi:AcrR family transcriptional regulator